MPPERSGKYLELEHPEAHRECHVLFRNLEKIQNSDVRADIGNFIADINRSIKRISKDAAERKVNNDAKLEAESFIAGMTLKIDELLKQGNTDEKPLSTIRENANGRLVEYIRSLAVR